MPLRAQNEQNQTIELPKPKRMLTTAVAIKPPAKRFLGDVLAPRTPDRNLLKPYAIGKMEVMVPTCVMSILRAGSAVMTGAVYVRLLRVR